MQLHIKLPKGKVRDACHKAASWNASMSQQVREKNDRISTIAAWDIPVTTTIKNPYREAAHKLNLMASACQYSVGDVYVSMELWSQLAAHYNHG